ncbi:MAG: Zn-ribbon domain-containing protein [Candidatus Woesearchaeota archaeon]
MPHQCVKCGTFYDDGASEILKGCSCGGRLFFYVKKEKLEDAKKEVEKLKLSKQDKERIEKDVFEIIGARSEEDQPVILDLESVKILKPGQYELDLVNLFQQKQPLIYKLEDGKYMVDLAESFKKMRREK